MADVAISAAGLSKKYRIGSRRGGYRTLRDSLMRAARLPLQALRRRENGVAAGRKGGDTMWALADVSFEILRGQVVGIIGRNGAGKSTLLKILSRITDPTAGYADVYGRVGSLLEVGTGFHPELTGRENIFLNGAILGMRRTEILRKFDEIVDFAEVERFIDTPVKHYSSGMYLRLAFAVAAHLEPEILLVDEVLAVGDAAFQKKCLGRMQNVAHGGRTVLFVSHNMGAVRSLCDRGIFLHDGRIVEDGDIGRSIEAYYRALGINGQNGSESGSAGDWRSCFGPVTVNDGLGNTINQGETFTLATRLRIDRPVSGFFFFCHLEDMQGRELVCLREENATLGYRDVRPGEYRCAVTFPPLWLVPGLYSAHFKVMFWDESGASGRHLSDKFPLDVAGVSSVGNTTGSVVLHPQVNWSVEREALAESFAAAQGNGDT